MTEIKLVIFDCDGVLVDSELLAAEMELKAYKEYGFEMEREEFSARFAGSSTTDIMKVVEAEIGHALPDEFAKMLTDEMDRRIGKEVKIIKGADDVLDRFDQPRCICSNSPQTRLEPMLKTTGLYDRFRPYVFSAKDFDPPRNKPKPDVFLKALEEFGVKPREAVVIEDSAHGIEGAVKAGCRVIGFTGASHTWPSHSDVLTDAGAETVMRNLNELPDLIEVFSKWDGFDG